ncbi:MAG TPA: hypothetical protein VF486_23085 [Actinomycetes bacterium]
MPGDQGRGSHHESVAYMLTPEFAEVRELFEAEPEIGGAYFRPLEPGVRVVDLHPGSPKPRIPVEPGSLIKRGTTAAQVAPTIPERVEYLRRTREEQAKPSREHRFEARLIRHALATALRLPRPFPAELRFLYSQWRIDQQGGKKRQDFADLVAVDIERERLVVVELKVGPSQSAAAQVSAQADHFRKHADALLPLFGEVATMMGELYGCYDVLRLELDRERVDALVVSEANGGEVTVAEVTADAAVAS